MSLLRKFGNGRDLLDLNFTIEDEIRRTGEGNLGKTLVGTRFKANGEHIATTDGDLDGRRGSGEEMVNEGAGGDASATGESFSLYAALVGADGEVIGSENLDKIGVGAIWLVVLVVANGGAVFDNIGILEVIDEGDGMWNAGVEIVDGGA